VLAQRTPTLERVWNPGTESQPVLWGENQNHGLERPRWNRQSVGGSSNWAKVGNLVLKKKHLRVQKPMQRWGECPTSDSTSAMSPPRCSCGCNRTSTGNTRRRDGVQQSQKKGSKKSQNEGGERWVIGLQGGSERRGGVRALLEVGEWRKERAG